MSEKSLNSTSHPLHRLKNRLTPKKEKRTYNWRMLALFPAWVTLAYITSNLVNISAFTLQNLSSGDSLTQDVRFTITGVYNNNSATVTNSAEIRSK